MCMKNQVNMQLVFFVVRLCCPLLARATQKTDNPQKS